MMKNMRLFLGALTGSIVIGAILVVAQQPAAPPQSQAPGRGAGAPAPAPMPMSFFVTSVGKGDGANLGGLAGMPNQHDALTGSQIDGRAYTDAMDHTCGNWTSNTAGMGSAQLGHIDRQGRGANSTWNSSHGSRGCSQPDLVA